MTMQRDLAKSLPASLETDLQKARRVYHAAKRLYREAIMAEWRRGRTYRSIAAELGIGRTTFERWLNRRVRERELP